MKAVRYTACATNSGTSCAARVSTVPPMLWATTVTGPPRPTSLICETSRSPAWSRSTPATGDTSVARASASNGRLVRHCGRPA